VYPTSSVSSPPRMLPSGRLLEPAVRARPSPSEPDVCSSNSSFRRIGGRCLWLRPKRIPRCVPGLPCQAIAAEYPTIERGCFYAQDLRLCALEFLSTIDVNIHTLLCARISSARLP